ncbi:MAG: phosphorybosylanthranilate isomerase, partial [Planctomycetes bacterium]|nr:phosphorybosylanthranilate isomerase [Planctomycetota bacterium]
MPRAHAVPGPVIGVVHLLPLPGSPRYGGSMAAVLRRAVSDARAYERGGADAVVVENYGDAPFFKEALPAEAVAALACAAAAVRDAVRLPLGINALRNDARA